MTAPEILDTLRGILNELLDFRPDDADRTRPGKAPPQSPPVPDSLRLARASAQILTLIRDIQDEVIVAELAQQRQAEQQRPAQQSP